MSTCDPVVERRLDQAANRWKLLRFGQHAATLGAGLMVLLLLVGTGRVFGGLPAKFVVASLIVLALLTPLALMVLVLAIVNSRQERAWLARAWERAYAPLLDRLNTLIYLEQEKETPITQSFAGRIKKQAHAVLARKDRLPAPFPATRALIHGLIFAALLLPTLQFYARYKPWEPPPVTYQPPPAPSEPPPLVLPPPESVVEKEKPWGEVRITKPGVDLAVTPAEDVPLQIEAATNRPLQSVNWFTAVNGGEEQSHALPPPDEPLFAAYQPVLIPQDMHLAEWDVVTYHAQATTQDGLSFRSEVYFVEIRPFRAAILEESGGEHTELYEILNDLTGMIEQQQEVIRQTYRGEVRSDGKPTLPDHDRNDLARSEDDLAQGAEHLAARLAAATDHPAVKDPVERLGEARSSLKEAAGRLRNDAVPDAQRRQRDALAQLVAARQRFQKVSAGNPDAFKTLKDEKFARTPAPRDMLAKIAEFRDNRRAAQEFVKQTLEEQRKLTRTAQEVPTKDPNLAQKQEALGRSLDEFRKQFPQAFQGVEKPCHGACQAMSQAAQALRQKAPNALPAMNQAANQLDALDQVLQGELRQQQLADAYKLKQMLDQEIGQVGRIEKDPDALPPEQVRETIEQAKETVRQLKEVAEKAPTRDDFGESLRQALSPKNQEEFEKQCRGLGQCLGGGPGQGQGHREIQRASGAVKQSLETMARAFEQGQPRALAGMKRANLLKPGGQEALDRGLAQLERLTEKGLQEGGRLTPGQVKQQRAEALANIEAGVYSRLGYNDRTIGIVERLKRDLLDKDQPVEAKLIETLRADLQERRVEVSSKDEPRKPEEPRSTHIDPTRLPPAYRKAIETYFEKLAEPR